MSKALFDSLNFIEKSPEQMQESALSFYQEMKRRRTVRDFSDRPVPAGIIENALLAAGTAPNGANRQPWHFVVISNKSLKRKIRLAAEKEERAFYHHRAPEEWLDALKHLGTDENKRFLEMAPHLIVIFSKKYTLDEHGKKLKNYYPQESVGIATGLLVTALHFSGLATLTHTPSPMNFLNQVLQRPSSEKPFLILVTGYPAESAKVPRISKKPLEQIATFID